MKSDVGDADVSRFNTEEDLLEAFGFDTSFSAEMTFGDSKTPLLDSLSLEPRAVAPVASAMDDDLRNWRRRRCKYSTLCPFLRVLVLRFLMRSERLTTRSLARQPPDSA